MKLARVIDVGKENATFQHLEVLKRNRAKRAQYGEVFVEGVAGINALLRAGWKVIAVAYDRERPLSGWAREVIAQADPESILRLAPWLMEKVSDREDPSELIVIAERRVRRLDEVRLDPSSALLIFDRPSNHGNLGSLIRSCDAFGVSALITLGHSVDIFDPVVLRASLGAFFSVPVIHSPSPREIEAWLAKERARVPEIRLVGTSAEGARPIHEVDLTGPVAVVLGNEAGGMSRKLVEMVDELAAIPMAGTVDSLNVACAGTVVLYELARQRGFPLR